MKPPTKNSLAEEVCKKYPDWPKRRIARHLCDTYPEMFGDVSSEKDVHNARQVVLQVTGNHGNEHRRYAKAPRPNGTAGEWRPLPKSYASVRTPYELKGERIGILSDLHVPYFDLKALTCALDFLEYEEADTILLNGDIWDCHMVSAHQKDPLARSFSQEREATIQVLAHIRDRFKDARIVYKLGNHEERIEAYVQRNAKEIADLDELRVQSLLRLSDFGIECIADKRLIAVCRGNLSIIHGHEYRGGFSAPVNPARGLFLRAKATALQGHNHQTSEHSEPSITGQLTTCWSTGCLCELSPLYMPYSRWNHGFAFVKTDGKTFHVRNHRIISGELV